MNTQPTLSPERKAALDGLKTTLDHFLVCKAADQLGYLWSRWQDEKEYEDFADYEAQMKKLLAEHAGELTFVKGTKRPFGLQCTSPVFPGRTIAITVSGRAIKWKVH